MDSMEYGNGSDSPGFQGIIYPCWDYNQYSPDQTVILIEEDIQLVVDSDLDRLADDGCPNFD